MTKVLPGQKGLLGKLWDGVCNTAKAIFTPTVYMADRNAETQTRNTDLTIESNARLEKSRQNFRELELQLQELQRKDNLAFQVEQGERNRSLQAELAELSRAATAYENDQNRQLQAYLAEINREAIAHEGKLNRQLQTQLAELNREFQSNEGKLNREHAAKLELLRIDIQKWCLEQQRELQLQLKALDAELARELRIYDRQTSIEVIHEQKRQNNSPIWLIAEDLLTSNPAQQLIPLRVFFSPPTLQHDRSSDADATKGFPEMEQALGRYLRDFFGKYSAQGRPIEFLAGAWTSKFFHSEAATKAIFRGLKTEPAMILESAVEDSHFDLNFAYWGLNWAKPRYKSAISLSWRETLYTFAKMRALNWKEKRDAYIASGKNPADFDNRYGMETVKRFQRNLEILQRELECIADGDDPTEIERPYSVHQNDYDELCRFLATCHCLFAGLLADEYFLVHVPPSVRLRPLFPELLPELLSGFPDESLQDLVEIVVDFYETLYNVIGRDESGWFPELKLDLALSLIHLQEQFGAKKQVDDSIRFWLQLHGLSHESGVDELEVLGSALSMEDLAYVEKLNLCLASLGVYRQLSVVDSCYNRGVKGCEASNYQAAIYDLSQAIQLDTSRVGAFYNRGLAYTKVGEYEKAIADYSEVVRLEPSHAQAYNNRGNVYYKLGDYERAIADYDRAAKLGFGSAEKNRDIALGVLAEINQQKEVERRQREEAQLRKREEVERRQREEAQLREREELERGQREEAQRREREELERGQREEAQRREREELERGQGKIFEFEVVTVNAVGEVVKRDRHSAKCQTENLGGRVTLEMVYIPDGTFQMGSSESDSEKPQHRVTVPSFFMGKFPVTQAQWKVVAALPQVNISLNPDPSDFKGGDRPVENITWNEAVEFCSRLSKKTGRNYRLPSEAEWEYACRARTSTPFHFGETITTDLANYNGNYTYGSGPKGTHRQQTTSVGSFPPNVFGLYDMHGNVWEWCADPWYDSYNGAPDDGSVWESGGNNQYRMLRGGSWRHYPKHCRTARRHRYAADSRYWFYGFRVVVGSSAWTLP